MVGMGIERVVGGIHGGDEARNGSRSLFAEGRARAAELRELMI